MTEFIEWYLLTGVALFVIALIAEPPGSFKNCSLKDLFLFSMVILFWPMYAYIFLRDGIL